MQKNTKRKERPWRDSQPDSEDGRVPHGALYFQAYEADIVRGPQAKSLAESLESSSAGNSNTALLRVNESSTSLDSLPKDVWVDRYDIRLLLDPFDRRLATTADPCNDRSESPTGWSDLPSDSEDTFFASSEEVEDHRRAKKRRKNEEVREHRLRALPIHEEDSEEQEKLESNVWGLDDEEPDEAVRQVMQKTARLILSASNPTQMEMKILVDFGEKEPSFAFLRGRWKHRWKEICSAMSQSLAAEAKAGENSGIGGLADYGDSEDEEPE